MLLDTNVLSETRKGERASPGVVAWLREQDPSALFVSVLTVGELRRGVARVEHRGDAEQAARLRRWIDQLVERYAGRVLGVDVAVAERWAALGVPDPVPVVDGLLAATALVHGLVVATRNTRDFPEVETLNPFA